MAENTIDTLELEIKSNSEQATQSIERLVDSLLSLDKSLSNAGKIGLRNFQSCINGAMMSLRDFADLAKTPIKLNIQTESQDSISKMKSSLERALGESKIDTSKIASQLTENFNITGKKAIQNINQQLQDIVEHFVDSFDGGTLKLSRSALDNLVESISDSAKIAKSNLSGEFSGMESEYEEFYNYFKNKKIYISDFLKNDIGKSEFKQALESNLSNITRNAGKGVDLNSVWEELSQKFPTIISPDTVNAADQVLEVLQKINEARDKIKPVSVNTLFGKDYDAAIKNIQESALNAVKEAKENLVRRTDEIFSSSATKINLDIEINEDKIVSDIQSAIRKASKIKYTPVNVELDVNADKIKNTITDKLKGLDVGNIPTLSEEISKISQAMVSLSGINLKDAGISTVINSISRLGKVFKDIPQDSALSTSNSIKSLSDSLKSLEGIKIPEVTGVENLVTAMRGISKIGKIEIDISRISTAATGIKDITDALRGMSGLTIPNLDGIENLIVNLRKLGGVNIGNAGEYLPKISQSLVSFVEELNRVGSLRFDFTGVASLVQNISQLGSVKATSAAQNLKPLKDQLLKFISGLNGIESLKFDVTGLSNLVSSISRLGGKAAGNAVPNIQNLASALKQMMATLSTAPKVSQNLIQMTQAMAQLANSGNKVSNLSAGISSGFGRIIPVANKAKKSTAGLASALGKFYATYWLFIRGIGTFKKAIDISSNLTEVQNVVDQVYGDLKYKVEDLASTSIQDFGMSELTAKEISSRFQAMGIAMGFAQDKMSDMSIGLTKLAADMASFYNVEQEAVARSLQSVFSGETEPLRKFGLDLTNATLQSWALAQGLDVNVQKMSQMEKTALRYRYVMANTAAAQGDFARTADTWHNSLVRLGQSFQQLGGVVGGVLVNAFKPFVSALNSVMQSVIKFAQTVANALGAIFGWTIEINSGGLATDFEAAGAGAEEMDKGTGGAAKNLKDMNKYIAAWHEVNNMTTDDNAGGGGGGGGGAGGGDALGDAAEAQFVRTEGLLEKYKSEIDSLYELGEYIGDTLTKAMNDIDWDSVYQKARNFGTGLAEFLNGLIDPDLFAALGGTIAGAVNTALKFLDSFGKTFNFTKFGQSIATGMNEFFRKINWNTSLSASRNWGKGIANALNGFINVGDFYGAGSAIANALNTAVEFFLSAGLTLNWVKVGDAIAKSVNGFFNTFQFGKLADALNAWAKGILDTSITALSNIQWVTIGIKIGEFIEGIDFASILGKIGMLIWEAINAGIGMFAGMFNAAPIETAILAVVAALKITPIVIQGLESAKLAIDGIKIGLSGLIAAVAANPLLAIGAAVAALALALYNMKKNWDLEVAQQFEEFQKNIGSNIDDLNMAADALKNVGENTKYITDNASEDVKRLGELGDAYLDLADKTNRTKEEDEKLKDYADKLIQQCPLLAQAIDGVTGKYTTQEGEIRKLIKAQQEQMQVEAYKKVVGEYADALSKANVEMAIAQKNYDSNAESLGKLQALFDDYMSRTGPNALEEWAKDNSEALNEMGYSMDNLGETLENVNWDISFYQQEQAELSDAIKGATDEVNRQQLAYETANGVLEQHKQNVDNITESTETYKQALADLETDLSNLNINLSENFMKDLVKGGYDSTGLREYFASIQQGVVADSYELQKLFNDMGLSLPNEMAKGLEGKDAEIQTRIVAVLMGIQSGVQATAPQLTKLFSDLGIDLPEKLIKSLSSKDALTQSTTIELLSKLENGYKLTEGNLKTLFENLGYALPDNLISSLSKKEVDVQSKALEVLGQIMSAEESQKKPLIEAFNSLGAGIIDEGIISSFDSGIGRTSTSVNSYIQNGILAIVEAQKEPTKTAFSGYAAYSEQGFREKIEDLATNSTPAAMQSWATRGIMNPFTTALGINSPSTVFSGYGKNTVEGFNQGISNNAGSTKGVIGSWISALTGWVKDLLGIKSPSKVFAGIGGYTVEGFNNGIEDNVNTSYATIDEWVGGISERFKFQVPELDLSIPKPDLPSKPYNLGSFQSTMQMEMDAKMAALEFENRQLRESMEQNTRILEEILDKGIVLDNNEFTKRFKSSATDFRRRTGGQLGVAF